jgi:hypothetical protein
MLKTADILLTSHNTLTVWFMRLFQRDPVNWGHAAIVENKMHIIEAKKGISRITITDWFKGRKKFKVIRLSTLTDEQAEKILSIIRPLIGQEYGAWRYVLQFFDHITGTNWFTKWHKNPDSQICSSLVAWGFFNGIELEFNNTPWYSCEPDDIEDESETNSDFTVVEV